jgi:hypothetical protein
MAAIERRQAFTVLDSRCGDKGIAKFQTMAPAISPQALTGQLASHGINCHSVQPGKKGGDPVLLSYSHARSDFCPAHR